LTEAIVITLMGEPEGAADVPPVDPVDPVDAADPVEAADPTDPAVVGDVVAAFLLEPHPTTTNPATANITTRRRAPDERAFLTTVLLSTAMDKG
jgi:hypothetical protein